MLYFQLQNLVNSILEKDVILVICDLNTIAGKDHAGHEDVIDKFGHRPLNKRGEFLIEFCQYSNFIITNTFFIHRPWHKTIWNSSDGITQNLTDYIFVSRCDFFSIFTNYVWTFKKMIWIINDAFSDIVI